MGWPRRVPKPVAPDTTETGYKGVSTSNFRLLRVDEQEKVVGKMFQNEVVHLDGKHFVNCKFRNVRLRFSGEATSSITGCTIDGFLLDSDNPSVNGAWTVARGLGLLSNNTLNQGKE